MEFSVNLIKSISKIRSCHEIFFWDVDDKIRGDFEISLNCYIQISNRDLGRHQQDMSLIGITLNKFIGNL